MTKIEKINNRLDAVLFDLETNHEQCSNDNIKEEILQDLNALKEAQAILNKLNKLNPVCLKAYL